MKASTRAALLSGLILPGLGQFHNGQKAKAGLLMIAVVALVIGLGARIFSLVYHTFFIQADAGLELLPGAFNPETLQHVHLQAYSQNWWLLLIIIVLWIYSILDAYRVAKKREPPLANLDHFCGRSSGGINSSGTGGGAAGSAGLGA